MTRRLLAFVLSLAVPALPATAETLVAAGTIRAQTILTSAHIAVIREAVPGALSDPAQALGQETRVILYAGRPIRPTDLGPPAVIDRNQIVRLVYRQRGLAIVAEGRALDRAGAGERVRVLNIASRATVTGTVAPEGHIVVGPPALSTEFP
ncbi:MAG: flagellar basal body P-ring formation chaperone FlgA [Pseudomonadota bacterium]